MDTLQLKEKVLKVNYKGKDYEISYPTVERANAFGREFIESENQSECVLSYMEELGLPREEALKFQSHHILEIVETLVGTKKK